MTKLYVIGNGFDLWHGLPTSYDRFYLFAKEMIDELEQFYSFEVAHNGPWNDFENSLGCFDWNEFYEYHNQIDVSSEGFRRSDVFGLEDELTEQSDCYVEEIREQFQEWVESIDITVAQKKFEFPQGATFITFNYTTTLQSTYEISDDRVFHLHGQAGALDELIFGHGETMEEEPELDESGDSNRTMFSDAEGAAKYPFYALRKPVDKVLAKTREVFESARDVSEIIVIGHSLNKIDLPYFKELAACAPNARWVVCCFREEDKAHHAKQLVGCNVRPESIRACTYANLEEELRHEGA